MKIASFWGDRVAMSENCTKCGLNKGVKPSDIPVAGKGRMNTLLVMNCPSKEESKGGSAFRGYTMSVVKKQFADCGIDIEKEFWKTNALLCYIKKIKDAKPEFCRENLINTIKKYKPKHIIPIGTFATNVTLGHMTDLPGEDSLPFNHIPVSEYNAWVHPMYNPQIKGTKNEIAYYTRAFKDIAKQLKKDEPLIKVNPFEKVKVLTDYDEILDALEWLYMLDDPIMSWDIEATGLKPHWDGHFITSVGISTRERTFAFPLHHNDAVKNDVNDIEDAWIKVMQDPKIKKIAHNRKFDESWAEITTGTTTHGNLHCTMTRQHLLDHRSRTKGLKWQAFRRWGIAEYDKRARPYIEADNKGAKEMNRMFKMPLREQLLYVGADAYLTFKLSDEQDKEYAELDYEKKAYPFMLFHESTDTLKRMEARGMPASAEYYGKKTDELVKKMEQAQDKIRTDRGVEKYKKLHKKEFKQTSPVALKEVLFDIKGVDVKLAGKTASGGISVDEKSLKDIDDPLCDAILSYRKLFKLHNTYMAQFTRAIVDDRIHFTFSLTIPRSYRSSAFDPNLQNIPKHDEYANTTCRAGMLPEKGMGLGEMDFKGMEVSTSATYHEDPNFINYLLDESSDMHRDNTCDLWFVNADEVFSDFRYHTKNCWTFPQFYGDWYGSCAPELWKQVITKGNMQLKSGEYVIDRLKDNKIITVKQFTEHCKSVEDRMWNKRFKVYTAWKNKNNDFYIEHGYVETHMGFRFTGLLDSKQTSNYPIQGTAFHLLLWCLNKLDKWMVKEQLRSYICGQIHDSIIFIWHPDEIELIKKKMVQICTKDIRKEFSWINVPMGIDIELSPLREDGGNFSNIGK